MVALQREMLHVASVSVATNLCGSGSCVFVCANGQRTARATLSWHFNGNLNNNKNDAQVFDFSRGDAIYAVALSEASLLHAEVAWTSMSAPVSNASNARLRVCLV